MEWSRLYSPRRTGSERKTVSGAAASEGAGREGSAGTNKSPTLRTSFLRDYDRIIFSSAFRRLQNKTQVFPLPGAVFVHNRLTHSLEVASVGRSLGKAVGDALAEKYAAKGEDFREFYKYELPSVIAAACLAHDIGNPPFGHSGEDAIRNYFRKLEGGAANRFMRPATRADLQPAAGFPLFRRQCQCVAYADPSFQRSAGWIPANLCYPGVIDKIPGRFGQRI